MSGGGEIIWNVPNGADLSGPVFMCSGPKNNGTYASPVVYINDSTIPAKNDSFEQYFGFLLMYLIMWDLLLNSDCTRNTGVERYRMFYWCW